MRPVRAGQQNGSVQRSSGDLRVNALSSNSTVALRKSSSARMNAGRLPRDSAHPSGERWSNVLPSTARRSNSVRMSKKNKLRDSEHRSSKRPSGGVPQNNSARRSKNGQSSEPTRRYVLEPISQYLLSTSSCGKSGRGYPVINTSASDRLSRSIVIEFRGYNSQGVSELAFRAA